MSRRAAASIFVLCVVNSCGLTESDPESGPKREVASTEAARGVQVARPDQILRLQSFPARRVTAVTWKTG